MKKRHILIFRVFALFVGMAFVGLLLVDYLGRDRVSPQALEATLRHDLSVMRHPSKITP